MPKKKKKKKVSSKKRKPKKVVKVKSKKVSKPKSIAISVTIQSPEKTLNDNDLEKINNLIIETVENKTGAKIRS